MNQTYTFEGTTTCRTRNMPEAFPLREVSVFTHTEQVDVYLADKVDAYFSQVRLSFTDPEDLRQLICGLAKALHCMTNPEEETDDPASPHPAGA